MHQLSKVGRQNRKPTSRHEYYIYFVSCMFWQYLSASCSSLRHINIENWYCSFWLARLLLTVTENDIKERRTRKSFTQQDPPANASVLGKKITRNEMKYPFLPVLSEIKKRSSQHTSKEGNDVFDARMKCNVNVRFTCMRAHISERGRNISLKNSLLPSRSNEGGNRDPLPIHHRHLSAFVIIIRIISRKVLLT